MLASTVGVSIPSAINDIVLTAQCSNDLGNESVLIQLAQCWFSGLAISSPKI